MKKIVIVSQDDSGAKVWAEMLKRFILRADQKTDVQIIIPKDLEKHLEEAEVDVAVFLTIYMERVARELMIQRPGLKSVIFTGTSYKESSVLDGMNIISKTLLFHDASRIINETILSD